MVFFLILMRILILFDRAFNLDGGIWHLSEKVP